MRPITGGEDGGGGGQEIRKEGDDMIGDSEVDGKRSIPFSEIE